MQLTRGETSGHALQAWQALSLGRVSVPKKTKKSVPALPAVLSAGVTITTAFASARHTGNKVDAARYLSMFALGGVVVYIYSFLMPS